MRRMRRQGGWRAVVAVIALGMAVAASGQTSPQAAKQTTMVPMRDGVRLATDVYLPEGKGPFPVVVMRTPYDKNTSAGTGQDGQKRGYAMVIQDTRGRGASQGANLPFVGDGWRPYQDGYDLLEWIAKQPWCNGKIGTFGGSALGITQLGLAASGSPHLTTQIILVGAPSLYFQCVFPGGVFKKALVEDWTRITRYAPEAMTFWNAHPDYDAFWRGYDLEGRWNRVNVPAEHIGGWYDIFTQGTIDSFVGYQTKGGPGARGRQKLLIGPWIHGAYMDKAGELTFPNGKNPPGGTQDAWRWFDAQLKGIANGAADIPAVTYYTMGDTTDPGAPGNVWRTADRWPPTDAAPTPYYLTGDRGLAPERPSGAVAPLTYTYDPKDPTPTVGGAQLTLPAGPMDQRRIESRSDLITFTGAPLTAPLEVTGRVRVRLYASSDAPDTDFAAKLCDVSPDGRSINICEGILRARFRKGFDRETRMKPGQVYAFDIDLWSTSMIFNKGHRLRVQIASSSAPGSDPNPNTGEPFRASSRTQPAHNTVYCDAKHPSAILLPIPQH